MEAPVVGIITFLLIMFAIGNIAVVTHNHINKVKANIDMTTEYDYLDDSNIEILGINCSYNNLNESQMRVKNSGRHKLNYNELEIYLDTRIPRNSSNLTIAMNASTDLVDPNLWNPEEEILVNINRSFSNNTNYKYTVINQYGFKVEANCLTVVK